MLDVMLLTNFLAPFLPHLLKLGGDLGEKAAEEAAKKMGGDAWEKAKAIFGLSYIPKWKLSHLHKKPSKIWLKHLMTKMRLPYCVSN